MRFEAVTLSEIDKYSFVIGTKNKPDNDLKERIRSQIGEAMESLGFSPDSYSVTVRRDNWEEPEDRGYPELSYHSTYILFAITKSGDSAESLSDRELEEQREELARGIFPPEGSRVALVLLQDSSIGVIVTKGIPIATITGANYDRGIPSRRSGYRRR